MFDIWDGIKTFCRLVIEDSYLFKKNIPSNVYSKS